MTRAAVCSALVAVISCLLFAPVARAAPANATIRAAVSQLRVGLGLLHQKYAEEDTYDAVPKGYLDRETGYLPALAVDYSGAGANGFYWNLHVLYARGNTEYDGYKQRLSGRGDLLAYKTETHNSLVDTHAGFGYLIGLGSWAAIGPVIELGYTHWNRRLKASGGTLQVEEAYDAYRYGAGLTAAVSATDRLVLRFEGLYARQHARIGSDDIHESLGANPYWRLGAGVDYRLTGRLHIGMRATRVHYQFDESDTNANGFFEPRSKTTHIRFMASVGWSLF